LRVLIFAASGMVGSQVRERARADGHRALEIIAASGLDWIAPRPARVVEGPTSGPYRVGADGAVSA
jgi:nucleoside-diphosphate-sugar epimerase